MEDRSGAVPAKQDSVRGTFLPFAFLVLPRRQQDNMSSNLITSKGRSGSSLTPGARNQRSLPEDRAPSRR